MPDNSISWYLVATDDGSDPTYAATREAGFDLAARDDAGVILYDRTSESKLTNPYPSGPWSDEGDALSPASELEPETLRDIGRAYLADQMLDGRARGVPVRAHLAVDTGAKALADAVDRYQPAMVVFPESISDDGSLLDKVTHRTAADLLADTGARVVLIDPDGNQVS